MEAYIRSFTVSLFGDIFSSMWRNFTRKFLLKIILKIYFVFIVIRTTFLTGICFWRKFCGLEKPILLMFDENSFCTLWENEVLQEQVFLQDLFVRSIVSVDRIVRGVECWDFKNLYFCCCTNHKLAKFSSCHHVSQESSLFYLKLCSL